MKKIPKLFNKNNIKAACKTNNVKNLDGGEKNTDIYNSGIYKLKSLDCSKENVGEIRWNLKRSFTKHVNDIRSRRKSNFSQHV
jgi:hypothetical protein